MDRDSFAVEVDVSDERHVHRMVEGNVAEFGRLDAASADAGMTNDIKERAFWDEYQEAFEDAINNTPTEHTPWSVGPANKKWDATWWWLAP